MRQGLEVQPAYLSWSALGAGGAPKLGKKGERNASSVEMSHVCSEDRGRACKQPKFQYVAIPGTCTQSAQSLSQARQSSMGPMPSIPQNAP